jgi:hypothetical protein
VTPSNLFLIGDLPGFTPQIARLVSMMNYVPSTTLQAVAGRGVDELDYLHDRQSNSIGTLLSHIAAAEVGYQAATFDVRDLNAEERQQWRVNKYFKWFHVIGREINHRGQSRWLRSRAMKRS